MKQSEVLEKIKVLPDFSGDVRTEEIIHGDMPGDKVCIEESHLEKARIIFPALLKELGPVLSKNEKGRAVVAVCGGSGVGKSETASLLSHFFRKMGIGAYTLSGDNYPHRIPRFNDGERLRIFRQGGLDRLIASGGYTKERKEWLLEKMRREEDADKGLVRENPWLSSYIEGGIAALFSYLGTEAEIDFSRVESIVEAFKGGADKIFLKRMGREESELWYDEVDFSDTHILVIEWTHGNSDGYRGVDIPILLNSTPEETLAHRRSRNRDGKTDSPFTMRVLELEQKKLHAQAKKAKIILSKQGELLDYEEYLSRMGEVLE